MSLHRLAAIILVAATATGMTLAAPARGAADRATVADLASGLVRMAEADGGAEAGRRLAADLQQTMLAGHGSLPLTERLAVDILRGIGVAASTSAPERFVSPERLEGLLSAAASGLGGQAATPAAGVAPASLDDCLMRPNHGQCVICCKALGLRANSCAKLCFAINKPSPSEPLP
jgi:hypothetical protein